MNTGLFAAVNFNNSTAGSATITNAGPQAVVNFNNNSTAGSVASSTLGRLATV